MFRRQCVGVLAAMVMLSATGPLAAQTWPTRAVSMVVPFGAGSASDTVGRIIGAVMSNQLGQQVVVENVAGAGGMTGTARVVNAAPDGYQFSFSSVDTIAINQTLYKKPLYNSATDFSPVTLVVDQPIVLIVRAGLPVNNLQEFIAYTKANQSKMQFGSSGVGSTSHLSCARVNAAVGLEPAHIPYRGSGQAMQDLAGGRIDYFCALGAAAVPPIEAKTAKAIAVLAEQRSPLFPDVASSKEQGLPGVETYFWSGFFYPKGTPAAIVQKLQQATSQALDAPGMAERLKKAGALAVPPERRSTEHLKQFVIGEIAQWEKTIKASGVSID